MHHVLNEIQKFFLACDFATMDLNFKDCLGNVRKRKFIYHFRKAKQF